MRKPSIIVLIAAMVFAVDVMSGAAVRNNEDSVFVMQALRGMLRAAHDSGIAVPDTDRAWR